MQTLYTLGGADNLRTARKYFAAAVELTEGGSPRALFGLWLCAAAVAALKGSGGVPKPLEDDSELEVNCLAGWSGRERARTVRSARTTQW